MTIFNPPTRKGISQYNPAEPILNSHSSIPSNYLASNRNSLTATALVNATAKPVERSPFSALLDTISNTFSAVGQLGQAFMDNMTIRNSSFAYTPERNGAAGLVDRSFKYFELFATAVRSFFSVATPTPIEKNSAAVSYNYSAATQFTAYIDGKPASADLAISNTIKDKHGNPVILNRDALIRFEAAIAEYDGALVTSSFRTHEEQAQLYRSFQNGNNPYPAARPGHSDHQSGFALDISLRRGDQERIHAALTGAGFVRPIPIADPVHWIYVGPVSFGKNPVVD